MSSTENLNPNGSSHKKNTHSRTDGSKSAVAKLPDATRPSAPEKVRRTITGGRMRDSLALAQVVAATAVPPNVSEQSEGAVVESAQALYDDFRAADSIDSMLARLMCGISNMAMDALARGLRCHTLEQRDMELKSATRGALVIAELTKAYDGRRARGKQTVNVGQVNVEAGGQAVVGNVTSASRPGEVAHLASMPQDECVGNATSERRPEEAIPGISLPQPKIEDPAPPKK
jgi:hypothetical protein